MNLAKGQKSPESRAWSNSIRTALIDFAKSALRERGDTDRAADFLGVSRSAIDKMKDTGLGSVESWVKLAAFKTKLDKKRTQYILENLSQVLAGVESPSGIDQIFEDLKSSFSDQELAAWMKLLLSKKRVEDEIGITIKASLQKKRK